MSASEFAPELRQKSAYKFWVRDIVRFTDLDALGHVSAVRTNEYFNTARANLFRRSIENWPHAAQLPVLKLATVLYEQEMHFPADIDVGLVIEKWGRTSVTVALGAFSPACVALTRNVFVFIDAKTRLPVPPDDKIRQNFAKLAEM